MAVTGLEGGAVSRGAVVVVLSGPSGAGKSTLERALRARRPDLAFSVSATTRPPRPGEVEGVHYRFVGVEAFERAVAAGEFLEHARVHGHLYGTPRPPVEACLRSGRSVLMDIDVQGAEQVRTSGLPAVFVFIAPPSVEVLADRLRGRGTEDVRSLERRLSDARCEMGAQGRFDHVVVNGDREAALAELLRLVDRVAPRWAAGGKA
ncbi:MAG: guanylate kinase [Planctomycetes bacterium]|nr:guanylate kinase [Planctomycetota bacterium]